MTIVTYGKLRVNVISLISKNKKMDTFFFPLLLKALKMERERGAPQTLLKEEEIWFLLFFLKSVSNALPHGPS